MNFLVLSRKMIFLFLENMILFFRRKMKDDLSQKNTRKYDIFCIFSNDGISFSYKAKYDLLPKNLLNDSHKENLCFPQFNT